METAITPEIVRKRATAAHVTINKLMQRASVANSTFWRWEHEGVNPHPVTIQKVADALAYFEKERSA